MGMSALKVNPVLNTEKELVVAIAHLEHVRADVADLKTETRETRRDMLQGFETARQETSEMRKEIASAKLWALGLYAALTATIFGVMARGLGWI